MSKDLGASIRSRLLNLAKAEQSDFNQVLVRYALEPAGLSDEFANDPARQKMWLALLQKNAITIIRWLRWSLLFENAFSIETAHADV